MPHLPQVTPEMVGTLKTLGQICDFLSDGSPAAADVSAPPAPSRPDADAQAIQATLIGIVSELTGYPEEMLEMDMDIEADLGIDSIKRVEILSAVEAKMPHLPQVTPEMVGTLKTLGQICDFLSFDTASATDGSAPAAPSHSGADTQAIQATLIGIVSELTGYPEEMLEMDMDIEADLGIDSIKRVEILSAVEAKMPHLPQVTPEMVGTLKTLGQICNFLSQGAQSANDGSAPTAPSKPDADAQAINATLITIVSELTGYPEEMLELDMDIEADLGIDSIKRVEILSAVEAKMPHLPQVTPEMVGTLKTLGRICAFLSGTEKAAAVENRDATPAIPATDNQQDMESVPRQIIDIVDTPKKAGRPLQMASNRWMGIVGMDDAMAQSMVEQFKEKKIDARFIDEKSISEPALFSGIGGLIIGNRIDAQTAFQAAKNACPELTAASDQGDVRFAVVTKMDGAFGFTENAFDNPEQGALPGLAKTAALEWTSVICRAIDLSPDLCDAGSAARHLVAELLTIDDHEPVEIGLFPDRRVTLSPVPAQTADGPINMDRRDVIVVTGGARGVTAQCALALARATGASFALVGRSAPPSAIPDWLVEKDGEAAIKKAIIANHFSGSIPKPAALEAAYREQMANLEITRTLAAFTDACADARYFCADVTDADDLNQTVGRIRESMGPITGIIHGAGVLRDRLIADKTLDQFRLVYRTKVKGFKNLMAATKTDPIGHIVLFSSVSARTGNTGQCDYAMANEALNKLARMESMGRPQCRVSSINWGPWDGGMVTPALKKAFADMDIRLIPIDAGARLMVAEMQNADPAPVEVVIGSMLSSGSESISTPGEHMSLLERREVDLSRYPVLASHIIGGAPVVPFALISEWIGHGALKENPGFSLHGIDDFRLLSGIRIEKEVKRIRLMAGKARKNGDTLQVEVELRNGVKHGKDVIHSRAKALLVDRFPAPPVYSENGKNGARAYPKDLNDVYGKILFHGQQLRAIQSIENYSDHGMTARLAVAPAPESWMSDPIRKRWTADPMVMDGALQMAILWCFEQKGMVCLPSYAHSYRQYRASFPPSGVTAVMNVTHVGHRKMVADFTFLDDDNQVVATMSGCETIIDGSLIHAFKNNRLPSLTQ